MNTNYGIYHFVQYSEVIAYKSNGLISIGNLESVFYSNIDDHSAGVSVNTVHIQRHKWLTIIVKNSDVSSVW